eukprot:g10675.t1
MDGWSEVHYAARDDPIERSWALRGVDVDDATPAGLTLLIIAARHGHVGVVKVLLEKGAEVGSKQVRDDSDRADIDSADLEAKVSKTQGGLGCPIQVGVKLGEALTDTGWHGMDSGGLWSH